MVKLTDRCFCRFTAAMLVPLGRAPTWRFHTKLYKFGWSTFPNNARMKNRTELNLGKVFYVWLIYHIQDSWLNSLNGYDIYFWLRDTANQPLTVNRSVTYVTAVTYCYITTEFHYYVKRDSRCLARLCNQRGLFTSKEKYLDLSNEYKFTYVKRLLTFCTQNETTA